MRATKEMRTRWEKYAKLLAKDCGFSLSDIKTTGQAWNIAFKLDLHSEAYHVGMNDNHIDTVLRSIFPNYNK